MKEFLQDIAQILYKMNKLQDAIKNNEFKPTYKDKE